MTKPASPSTSSNIDVFVQVYTILSDFFPYCVVFLPSININMSAVFTFLVPL